MLVFLKSGFLTKGQWWLGKGTISKRGGTEKKND